MNQSIKKIFNYFRTAKITPLGILAVVGGIFYFIFMETELFEDLPDIYKTAGYVFIIVFGVLTGVKPADFKEFGNEFIKIIKDKNMEADEKLQKLLNIAMPLLSEIGNVYELIYDKQFGVDTEEDGD